MKRTQCLFLCFPRERQMQTGDPFVDSLPDMRPIAPKSDETEIQIQIRLVVKTDAGPLPSRIGPMLDVIAGMSRDSDATSGELSASWIQEEPTPSDALDSAERPHL